MIVISQASAYLAGCLIGVYSLLLSILAVRVSSSGISAKWHFVFLMFSLATSVCLYHQIMSDVWVSLECDCVWLCDVDGQLCELNLGYSTLERFGQIVFYDLANIWRLKLNRYKHLKTFRSWLYQNILEHIIPAQNILGQNILGHNILGQNILGHNILGQRILGCNILCQNIHCLNILGQNILGQNIHCEIPRWTEEEWSVV